MKLLTKNNFIFIFIYSWFLVPGYTLNAQCISDAGDDFHVCSNLWGIDSTCLGGIPSASNGIAPYQYIWETNYYGLTGNLYTASVFLNDTTLANPRLLGASSSINDPYCY